MKDFINSLRYKRFDILYAPNKVEQNVINVVYWDIGKKRIEFRDVFLFYDIATVLDELDMKYSLFDF